MRKRSRNKPSEPSPEKPIRRRLELGRYAERFEGEYCDLWLNLPPELAAGWAQATKDAEIFSQPLEAIWTEMRRFYDRHKALFAETLGCSERLVERIMITGGGKMFVWVCEQMRDMQADYLKGR